MALPILETPTYELVLPSTDKKIKFRPFLVKEHKVLMTLTDAEDHEVVRVIKEVIDVCTFKKLKVDKLPNFDIEYIFLNLRSKSIGEKVDIIVNCPCGNKIDHTIDLNDLKIDKKDQSNTLKLRDNLSITMRYPTFEEVTNIITTQDIMKVFDVVSKCVDIIYMDDQTYDRTLFNDEEAIEFISQLTKDEFTQIEQFFLNMPKVVQEVKAECNACGKLNEVRMEGIENFFV